MSVLLLIRHAANDVIGRTVTGRNPGINLNETGRRQAAELADRLGRLDIAALFTSPMERARQTAEPLARTLGLEPKVEEALTEVDFGIWQGSSLAELEQRPDWRRFHQCRSGMRIPGGELLLEVQARMVSLLERCSADYPDGILALVSHGDPIRSVLAHYAGIPLDLALRLALDVCSVSTVRLEPPSEYWGGPRLLTINHTGPLPVLAEGP